MRVRVSSLESFRQWKEDDEQDPQDLVARILKHEPSEQMLAGSAFHKALQFALPGSHKLLEADGFKFHLQGDGNLALPKIRELRADKAYGPLIVTGCVDILEGLRVDDHKTTERIDVERYLEGYQWRFYLDLFGAEVFRWNLFEIRLKSKKAVREYKVKPPQTLEQHRYPELVSDCARLAAEFHEFAQRWLPDLNQQPEVA